VASNFTSDDRPLKPEHEEQPAPHTARRGMPQLPAWRYVIWLALAMVLAYFFVSAPRQNGQTIPYTTFKQHVRDNEVSQVTFQGQTITAELKPSSKSSAAAGGQAGAKTTPSQAAAQTVRTTYPPIQDPELMPLLEQHSVEIRAEAQSGDWWMPILIGFAPWLLLVGVLYYGARRMQQASQGGGIFGFGKSKAKRFRRTEVSIGFDDVAGLANAKRDLVEITAYLRQPQRYRKLGAKIPKGILLMGPPGTGKTLLAKAVAGESNAPFYSINGSEFIEMFVGVGASRVRDMFESAKKEAPSIIFIDEIDSVGRARGTGVGGGHDEREQTLNQILGEMDGFSPYQAVVVLAATNRPDVLDPALLRPGRFDRKIVLELPERKARTEILKVHSRDVPLAEDVDLDRVASLTAGLSGADLENLINEAALIAGREDKSNVDMETILRARDRVVLGAESETVLAEEEKRIVAYHEAGHAVAASLLPHADQLDKVTIIPRGRALGATEQVPREEWHNLQESYLRDRIGVLLAGRVTEQVVLGEVSSGAEQDLKQATRVARRMLTQWGMNEKIGPTAFRRGEEHLFLGREMAQQRDFSEATAQLIDEELRKLLLEIEHNVRELVVGHRKTVDAIAEQLLAKETLEAKELKDILDKAR
jgi:cell division protease FtsH